MRIIPCSLLLLLLLSGHAAAQGSLEPSNPPGLTMKTLGQVEPRTPISAPMTIANPGSYYLANDISGAIQVTANNVVLDLNGFTISNANPHGVDVNGRTNVKVFNGTIANSQSAGVFGVGVTAIHLHDLYLSGGVNCISFINPAGQIVVEHVSCKSPTQAGIQAIITEGTDLPLIAILHNNIVSLTSSDEANPRPSILVFNNGLQGTYADIRNNHVFGSTFGGIGVFDGPDGSNGTIDSNTVNYCEGTGIIINGNFVVTRNIANGNVVADYNFDDAPNAAAIKGINDSPGPWNNIAAQTPVPEA